MKINKKKLNGIENNIDFFQGLKPENRFVAFLDVLGFGNQVINEFENILDMYQRMLNSLRILDVFDAGVSIQIYSDSLLFTSQELGPLVKLVQAAQMQTLFNDFLVRGGVGYGKHMEINDENNHYVISQALVYAVEMEKKVSRPCIAFHDSVRIPPRYWDKDIPPLMRGIVHFDGISLISPLNIFWGTSAITRALNLSEDNPKYKEKYDWFIKLCEAILNQEPLVP